MQQQRAELPAVFQKRERNISYPRQAILSLKKNFHKLPSKPFSFPLESIPISSTKHLTTLDFLQHAQAREIVSTDQRLSKSCKSGDVQLTIAGYEGILKPIETNVQIMSMTGDVIFSKKVLCGQTAVRI